MNDLFPRANQIGLGCINSWLPNGRLVEDEWIAKTSDNEYSISVNIKNGKWKTYDNVFSGDHSISLYDWLNKKENKIESAREILEKYDPEYFPSDSDIFIIPEPKVKEKKKKKTKVKEKPFLDDGEQMPFRILGKSLDRKVYFHCFKSKEVIGISAHNLKSSYLIEVAPSEWWADRFVNPNGGIAWQAAQNYLLRHAEVMDTFDPTRVRRSGSWVDNGDIVFHAGEHLLINGDILELTERNGRYIYEKSRRIPIDIEDKLTTDQASQFHEIIDKLVMKSEVQKQILAGWCLLAPFGGALKWRPHIWLTGPAGSGKSWVLDNIVDKMVGQEFGIKGTGTSTPAGIRQNLQSTTLGVVLDEMESDNRKHADYIEQILKMFREASSGVESAASTLHGSVDQSGKSWLVRSMACFASIGASLRQDADIDRFTVLTMTTMNLMIDKRSAIFKDLEDSTQMLTLEYCRAFVARTYSLIKEVMCCIDVMIEQATDILESRRHGDQIGTLLAGSWMIKHDKSATAREAREWLETLELHKINSVTEDRSTEQKAIEEILAFQIRVTDGHISSNQTIGACLTYIFHTPEALVSPDDDIAIFPGATPKTVRQSLEQYGIKPSTRNGQWINIAVKHPAIRKILERTPYANVYEEYIMRLNCCESGLQGPGLFAGIRKRFMRINADLLFDEVPF